MILSDADRKTLKVALHGKGPEHTLALHAMAEYYLDAPIVSKKVARGFAKFVLGQPRCRLTSAEKELLNELRTGLLLDSDEIETLWALVQASPDA